MGVDYRAQTVIGVPLDWDHFFEEYEAQHVICPHEEAKGNRFCPVCGAREDERVKKVTKTRVRKPFLGMDPFNFSDPLDIDEGELHDFQHDTWRVKIGRVEIISLREDGPTVLGVVLHKTDSSNGGSEWCPSTPWEDVKDKVEFACDGLEDLGFDRTKVQCWTHLDCSY